MEESIYFKKVYFKDELPLKHETVWYYTFNETRELGWLNSEALKMRGGRVNTIEQCDYWLKEI
jgi:hypothetical protein